MVNSTGDGSARDLHEALEVSGIEERVAREADVARQTETDQKIVDILTERQAEE